MFITFEGLEASGKTTQSRRLAQSLRAQGHAVCLTREPGGTAAAEAMRAVLLNPGYHPTLPPLAQAMLACAARASHVEMVIKPALSRGEIVICDRFTDSTLVYQGYAIAASPLEMGRLRTLCAMAARGLIPDRTFVLDLEVETALQRLAARGGTKDAFETKEIAFWSALKEGFLSCARHAPTRCRVIPAAGEEAAVAAMIEANLR